jgi:hypothetical protein
MFCARRNFFIFKIFFVIILLFILFSNATVHSTDVILAWDRPNDARVTGYKIFYGLTETDFKSGPKEIVNSPDYTSCNISNLKAGQRYGFTAKSIDSDGNESVFSEVIFYDVPQDDNSTDSENGGGGCFLHFSRF